MFSSISMAERGEGPEGILLSMTRNRFHAALWHSGGWKEAAITYFHGTTMVVGSKPVSPCDVSTDQTSIGWIGLKLSHAATLLPESPDPGSVARRARCNRDTIDDDLREADDTLR
jgi:hypothetical protein